MNSLGFSPELTGILLWLGFIVLAAMSVFVIAETGIKLMSWRSLWHRKLVFLELTPPAFTARTPLATQQLFSVIHGRRITRSIGDRLFRRNAPIALEVVSTREGGVRYIVQTESRSAPSLQQAITSYLPDVKIAEVPDFLSPAADNADVVEFRQTGHYAFPLAQHVTLEQHDPVAYLTGVMTKLSPEELISFQIILAPVHLREASTLAHKILRSEDLLNDLNGRSVTLLSGLAWILNSLLFSAVRTIGEIHHGPTNQSDKTAQRDAHDRLQIAKRIKPARTLSTFELELMESMHSKLNQQLFQVSIRALVRMDSDQTMKERLAAINSSLAPYSSQGYQALEPKLNLPFVNRYRRFSFVHRLPAPFTRNSCILSTSEVASLYHFPLSRVSKTDNLVTSLSRTLPAPLSLKQNTDFSLVLGRNYHHGIETDIGLTEKERERHVYIIGGTGNGKTTMLQYGIVQDMQNGKGLAVIDPHGDMAETLLEHVPENRIEDVIYFNPDDLEYPIGLNLLEMQPGLASTELMREKDLITESVVSIFRKIFSDEDTGGHRIEYILRNTVQTALTVEDATLFTIFSLLNDPKYRKKVVANLENQDLKNFWKHEMGKAGEFQRVKMAAGITAKIGRFLFSASAKQILEQPKSTIDFDDIINSGKILICNFSKGLLGEDTSELFGITVLAKLQLASLRRARFAQAERQPFYLYVDEFQNFATPSFVQMLSEARKYKLFMMMAEQSTSQQKDQQMVSIILANVGTVICFRTGNPQDERLLLPLFTPYVNSGEISNLSAFNFYAKLSALTVQEPLSGQTVILNDNGSDLVAGIVVASSRERYAIARREDLQRPSLAVATEDHPSRVDLEDALPDEL